MKWNDGLTGESLKVAGDSSARLRVMAGPGTGKTYAMIRRIARLLQSGVAPEEILAVTFTRTAAADIAEELQKIGIAGADEVRATTLHSFGFGVLGRAKVFESTGRVARPILNFELKFLYADLHDRTKKNLTECKELIEAFSAAWARLQSETPGWPPTNDEREFARDLKKWLVFHRAMLLGEIITESWKYIRDNPAADDAPSFKHVLVDEYQDLNRAEQELIETVSGGASVTIIGDPDQSIYSFKFAHPEGIIEYHSAHPDTAMVDMGECRRCPSDVANMAACLIANNADSAENSRQLKAIASNGRGEVHIVQWTTFEEEATGIARFVEQRVLAGTPAGRVLILANRAMVGTAVARALADRGIPARSFFTQDALEGNPKEGDECAIQEAFTLLNLLGDPDDRVALRCWCGFGTAALNARGWREVWNCAENQQIHPKKVLEQLANGLISLPYTKGVVARYRLLLSRQSTCASLTGDSLLNELFPETKPWATAIRSYAQVLEGTNFEPAQLLKSLREAVTQPSMPADPDYVRVMSLHKSKGLTADLVVIAGCVEGLIPYLKDNLTEAQRERSLEEQRRLFYVALTRPRSTLLISSAVETDFASAKRMNIPVTNPGNRVSVRASQFIGELGPAAPRPVRGSTFLVSQVSSRVAPTPSATVGGNTQSLLMNPVAANSTDPRSVAENSGFERGIRFGLVTALPEEFAAMAAMLDECREWSIDKNVDPNEYSVGRIPSSDGKWHSVVITLLRKMGNNSAAAAVTNLVRSFPMVTNILMVGIAGGVPSPNSVSSHVRLGDIVVSNEYGVVQFDQGKLANGIFEVRSTSTPPSSLLIGKIRRLESERMQGKRPWDALISRGALVEGGTRPDANKDVLKRGRGEAAQVVPHPPDPHRLPSLPKVHYGKIGASNTLLKDEERRDALREQHSIKAVEMEGSGIADGAWESGRHYLLIRGICDYCDERKNDEWHGYAAVVAAAYARALLSSIPVTDLGL